MLQLALVRRDQVEFGHVGIHEELEVQLSIRRQADQGGGWRECCRQPRTRAGLKRAIPTARRGSDLVEIGRVVDVKSRLHRQHLVEGEWSPILGVDITRQQQIRPVIEHHAQLAPCCGDVIAAKRMVRMLEVADVTLADAARERDRARHAVAFERPAGPRGGAKRVEVPGGEIGGRLESRSSGAWISGSPPHRPRSAHTRCPAVRAALRRDPNRGIARTPSPAERGRRHQGTSPNLDLNRRRARLHRSLGS